MHCADNCANGSRNGSPGRRHRRIADDLRHVQGSGQEDGYYGRASGSKDETADADTGVMELRSDGVMRS